MSNRGVGIPAKDLPFELPKVPPGPGQGAKAYDPWRMEEWKSLPDVCFIRGCESPDADQRGPVFLRDGSIHKACPDHWEPIFRVLGEQQDGPDVARWAGPCPEES